MGRIACLDLCAEKLTELSTPIWAAEEYIGGLGLLAKALYDNIPSTVDALSQDNILGISAGPYNGAYSGRITIAAKSPLTDGWGESHSGGGFGPKLRKLGIDALFIKGKAEKRSVVVIDEQGITVKPYPGGSDGIYSTVERCKEEFGGRASVLAIGQGGDSLVRFAAISDGGQNYAARGGLGAVMGSKNLKAVVISAKGSAPAARGKYASRMSKFMKKNLTLYGTPNILSFKIGADFPTKNFMRYDFEFEYRGEKVGSIKEFISGRRSGKQGCPKCPVRCKIELDLEGRTVQIPEYEAFSSLGSNIENPEIAEIVELNELCNDHGLDVVSMGTALGFFFEAAENGVFNDVQIDEDIKKLLEGGTWGNSDLAKRLIEKIAKREGIGHYLAEGYRILDHERLFKDPESRKSAEKSYLHVKGVGPNGTDPRNHPSQALSFATSAMGATHLEKMNIYDEGSDNMKKFYAIVGREMSLAESIKYSEDISTISDALVFCKHLVQSLKNTTPELINGLLKDIFGKDIDYEAAASRITDLRRQFNIEHRKMIGDGLPDRFFEPLGGNSARIDRDWLKETMQEYYLLRRWNEDGTIPEQRMAKLTKRRLNLEISEEAKK